MGVLYLVSTPIGNLEDISARGLRMLREARLVAAEDTRHTQQLLNHFGIRTRLVSYHEHNKVTRLDYILAELAQGDVALVSDAGTPALNDPGYELVLGALKAGYAVSPIPGPSAPLAALVVSGLPTDRFVYLGYLPRKANDRRSAIQAVSTLPYTLIFLETPHRLEEALADLQTVLGDRLIAVARELTKLHEDVFRGSISAGRTHYAANPPRGEITLVVEGSTFVAGPWSENQVRAAIREGLGGDQSPSRLASGLAAEAGWARRSVYQLILEMSEEEGRQDLAGEQTEDQSQDPSGDNIA